MEPYKLELRDPTLKTNVATLHLRMKVSQLSTFKKEGAKNY